MEMRNYIKEKLQKNDYVLGAFVASGSPMNCECLAINGMDFIIIDAEHAQTSMETMVEMSRASELYGMAAFARVYDPSDGPMMSRLLDVGLHGIMVPLVETPEQAKMAVEFMKFPPLGKRGANGGRGPRWGSYRNYREESNRNLYVIMQCETCLGVENIDGICQTPGLDCVFIGTGDLSQDLGHPDDLENPEVVQAIDKVLKACQKHKIVPGIVTASTEDAIARVKQGFQLVTCMNDQVFFRKESEKRLQAIRQGVEQG